jgi:hypothetical protein
LKPGKRGLLFGTIAFEVTGGPDAQRLVLEFPLRPVSGEPLDSLRQVICCYWRKAHYGGRFTLGTFLTASGFSPAASMPA